MHFYLYIWLAVTVEVIEWRMFFRSFVRSFVGLSWNSVLRSTKFNTRKKPQLDTNVLADEIENYLWKCFFFCTGVVEIWKQDSFTMLRWFLELLHFLASMCSSCDPESVCRPVDVRFKLLFIFSFDEAFNKKSTKSRHFWFWLSFLFCDFYAVCWKS